MTNSIRPKGIIAWFTYNPVAANLLMVAIMLCGLASLFNIKSSLRPDIAPNLIDIRIVYPGAAPKEIEYGVTVKIEESLKDLVGITHISSLSSDSLSLTTVEISQNYDLSEVLDQIKTRIDAITGFPEGIERPIITRQQKPQQALLVQLYGDMNELDMNNLARLLRDEMLQDPGLSSIVIQGLREYEVSIEIPSHVLQKHRLSISDVVQAIKNSSQNIPGGNIKSEHGNITLRTQGQAYNQYDFEAVVIKSYSDGNQLLLGNVATIHDGFSEIDSFATFNGKPGVALSIYAVGNQNILDVAKTAKKFVAGKQQQLPPKISLTAWGDATYYLDSRISMMTSNMIVGAVLVFIMLTLFLELKIAFWVMAGLPISFLGAFALMPIDPFNVSLNMVSLFGFLLVLGIVVDDAIIISESIHRELSTGSPSVEKVIIGANRVAMPATFGVLTTIIAFTPTIFIEGSMSAMPQAIGYVVIFCLIFSLIESKWILPSHLGHMITVRLNRDKKDFNTDYYETSDETLIRDDWAHEAHHTEKYKWFYSLTSWIEPLQKKTNQRLNRFVENTLQPFVEQALRMRYLVLSIFMALLILTIGLLSGGVVRYVMLPDIPSDFLVAKLNMVNGASDQQNKQAIEKIQSSLLEVEARYLENNPGYESFIQHRLTTSSNRKTAMFMVELIKSNGRTLDSFEIINQWRDTTGDIAGSKSLTFSSIEDASGAPLSFKLTGAYSEHRHAAAAALEAQLHLYQGVFDVENSATDTSEELVIQLKDQAQIVGLNLSLIGTQVHQAFHGAEAQRIQRNKNEVRVMVRYPQSERNSIGKLENMNIINANGDQIPLASIATITLQDSLSNRTRVDGEETVTVTARVDKGLVEPSKIIKKVMQGFAIDLQKQYPGIAIQLDGSSKEADQQLSKIMASFWLALLGVYILLAIPLRSYTQPIIIMSVIPFGIIGAVIGHIVMDMAINILSLFGIIALSGVVVNDSLVLVDFINREREGGSSVFRSAIDGVKLRFRAIFITSATTFVGLVPILFETSIQAQFVVPMAVSMSFGILFSTVITLVLIPVLYLILDDFNNWLNKGKTHRHA